MCGITGIVGADAGDKTLLSRMMDRVAHRGPDDVGTYHDEACSLGHRRLAIIDLAGGHEPILDEQGQRAIIYNGEIYNHETLRTGLEPQGHPFTTRSDAEVPLHLLEGDADARHALDVLDGMFSFAIWDSSTRRLLAARDPYGVKPFFWTRVGGSVLFASEIKALLAHPDVPSHLSDDAIREKAVFEHLLPGTTWIDGIHELPPGHFLVTDGKDVRIEEWYAEATVRPPADRDDVGRSLYLLLVEAVRKRLMSEVPLGVVLSGGLDSSLIAAIDQGLDPDRTVPTFSIADDVQNADLRHARTVAEALGTEHHEWTFTRDDLDRDLASMIWSNEDLDHETYFFYPLFRHMRDRATVGLCGQGADEGFGGYARYKDLAAHRAKVRARTAAAFPHDPERHDGLLEAHYGDLAHALAWERGPQLSDFQLRLVDRGSMAFGAEIRVPFLDKKVTAFGASLPAHLWIGEGTEKVAVRLAARHAPLPREIIQRPKVPAGRSTGLGVVESFERDAEAAYPDARAARHPYGRAYRKKAELLCLDLVGEIFEQRRGERPKDLHWNDLL